MFVDSSKFLVGPEFTGVLINPCIEIDWKADHFIINQTVLGRTYFLQMAAEASVWLNRISLPVGQYINHTHLQACFIKWSQDKKDHIAYCAYCVSSLF
jgi:hypothetical protein